MTESRISRLVILSIIGGVACFLAAWAFSRYTAGFDKEPIRIGILHSLTGTMAISERSVVDATLLAIEELNEKGGVLGRKIEPVVADGKSDWPTFAMEAERLITQEKVSVVFGCWTSASRKTVKPVFEKYNHLLFYPVQYEGLEESPNIVYLGASPNQQIIPALMWCMENLGKKIFLVGSDYIFPRAANAIIADHLQALGGEILGEEYLVLGSRDVSEVVRKIAAAEPDVILNTINGGTNVAFFEELRRAGVRSDSIPVMSLSITEDELRSMDSKGMAGGYACWNYFQSIESERNKEFVKAFRAKFGADRVVGDPMETAYFGVDLWRKAVEEAGTDDVAEVIKFIGRQSANAPEGVVSIDPENQHAWRTVRIGQIREDGQFDIVWTSDKPIRPRPYQGHRTKEEWATFIVGLYDGWGGNWSNVND